MTGQAARVSAALRASRVADVEWLTCTVCHHDYPAVKAHGEIERVCICQRCCVADVAHLMRTLPGTVCMLPTVRALLGKPQVVERLPEAI